MSKFKNILIGALAVPILTAGAIAAVPSWRNGIKDTIAKNSSVYKEQNEKLAEINDSYDLIHSQLAKNQSQLIEKQLQVEDLTQQQTILFAQLTKVTEQKNEAINAMSNAEVDIENCAKVISNLTEQKTQLEENLKNNEQVINQLNNEIVTLNQSISSLQEQLNNASSNGLYFRVIRGEEKLAFRCPVGSTFFGSNYSKLGGFLNINPSSSNININILINQTSSTFDSNIPFDDMFSRYFLLEDNYNLIDNTATFSFVNENGESIDMSQINELISFPYVNVNVTYDKELTSNPNETFFDYNVYNVHFEFILNDIVINSITEPYTIPDNFIESLNGVKVYQDESSMAYVEIKDGILYQNYYSSEDKPKQYGNLTFCPYSNMFKCSDGKHYISIDLNGEDLIITLHEVYYNTSVVHKFTR